MPEERANELWIEREWTEARTDDRTKWEVIALCLSPLRVYLITESIETMMDSHNCMIARLVIVAIQANITKILPW